MFSSRRSDPTHSARGPASRLAEAAGRGPAEPARVRHGFPKARHPVAAGMAIAGSAGMVMAGLLPAIARGPQPRLWRIAGTSG